MTHHCLRRGDPASSVGSIHNSLDRQRTEPATYLRLLHNCPSRDVRDYQIQQKEWSDLEYLDRLSVLGKRDKTILQDTAISILSATWFGQSRFKTYISPRLR